MSVLKQTFNSIDVFNPYLGSGIEVPKIFWKPGTAAAYNQHVGKTSVTGLWQGVLMAGMNPESPFSYLGSPGNVNLHWPSITTYFGQHTVIGRSSVLGIEFRTAVAANTITSPGPTTITGSFVTVAAKKATITGASILIAGAAVTIASPLVSLPGAPNFLLKALSWDAKKNFDIPHPTKKDHRLRHVCVEGPTADVYIRGKLTDSNVINLPDYWKDLVDEDSITVQLQPIGSRHFHLNVEKFDNKEIHIKEADDKPIDCFYHVYGERKDTTKNISEYEGLTSDDYPGDNREYVINGGRK